MTWPIAATSEVAPEQDAREKLRDAERRGSGRDARDRVTPWRASGSVARCVGWSRRCSRAHHRRSCDGRMSAPSAARLSQAVGQSACRPSPSRAQAGRPAVRRRSAARTPRQRAVAQDVVERAGGHDAPSASTSAWSKPGGISSTWWSHQHDRGRAWAARKPGEVARRASRARQGRGSPPVRRAAGGPDRASAPGAIDTRRRSPADSVPYGCSATPLRARVREEPARADRSAVGEVVPPRLGGGVARGHDEVDGREVVAQDGLDALSRRRRSDAAARGESTLPYRAPRTSTVPAVGHRVSPATDSSVVLPRPVRPDDDPALAVRGPSSRSARGSCARRAGPRRREDR